MQQGVEKRVDKYQYNTGQFLGTGSFGTVYKCQNYNTGEHFALKMMPRGKIAEPEKLSQEIAIMKKLKGPNIVRLYEVLQTQNNYYQVMSLCETDLQQMLKKEKSFSEEKAIKLMVDLLNGFLELIQLGIIHRDVKPANIMFSDGVFKLADFGFARMVDNYAGQKFVTILGTPMYMSPQILQDENYSTKCDIWSIGFIFYEALYGITPWTAQSINQLVHNIKHNALLFPDQIKPISELTKDVIKKCLKINEDERISWYELYSHPLFSPYFQNMTKLQDICQEKAKFIANRIRGEIIRLDISLEDLFVRLNLPQELNIRDIESFLKKADNTLSRIEAEHIFNSMTNGQSISIDKFKSWLDDSQIPKQLVKTNSLNYNGLTCIISLKTAMIKFNSNSWTYFDRFNPEKDGILKYSQYKLLILRIDKNAPEVAIKESFEMFDVANRGSITYQEFDSLLSKYEVEI